MIVARAAYCDTFQENNKACQGVYFQALCMAGTEKEREEGVVMAHLLYRVIGPWADKGRAYCYTPRKKSWGAVIPSWGVVIPSWGAVLHSWGAVLPSWGVVAPPFFFLIWVSAMQLTVIIFSWLNHLIFSLFFFFIFREYV